MFAVALLYEIILIFKAGPKRNKSQGKNREIREKQTRQERVTGLKDAANVT